MSVIRKNTMSVGERIKKARIEKGISQKKLADSLGVSAAMISQYENGVRKPKKSTLIRIADAIGVDVNRLDEKKIVLQINHQEAYKAFLKIDKARYLKRIRDMDDLDDIIHSESTSAEDSAVLEKIQNNEDITDEEFFQIDTFFYTKMLIDALDDLDAEISEIGTERNFISPRIQSACKQLNNIGQEKVADYAETIAKIPEYQKEKEPE
ncbi:MAG: helix-turn-helix domain-containing protein [Lachnospiraceae bacterium]|nr:helix-turn-helix domain-containing protein [Lachnospiraceae bacterium]